MKKTGVIYLLVTWLVIISCKKNETALEILSKTIATIDTIQTIYYKQDMSRTNPIQLSETIFRYREMYFKRLIQDSIVGVKGHWRFYGENKSQVNFEDIYDGYRLVRKNNRDSVAMLYDLIKFPEFKQKHFWNHNTLFGMQHEIKYILHNKDCYIVERLEDTIMLNKPCFQILIQLENKTTMPGFMTKLEDSEGNISKSLYVIDKNTYYPIRMRGENHSTDNPEQKSFIDQTYYDIEFNLKIDEKDQFDTSDESLNGFEVIEMIPE